MKYFSIYNAIVITALWLSVIVVVHAAVIPLPAVNPNPVLNIYTLFNWSLNAPVEALNQTFVVHLDSPSRVHVTDLDPHGSGFSVYDNGSFVGETATVITKNNLYSAAEYHYRQGFFNLETGHHIITVQLKNSSRGGSGSIQLIPGVNNDMIIVKSDNNNNNNTVVDIPLINDNETSVKDENKKEDEDEDEENENSNVEDNLKDGDENNKEKDKVHEGCNEDDSYNVINNTKQDPQETLHIVTLTSTQTVEAYTPKASSISETKTSNSSSLLEKLSKASATDSIF